MRFGAGTVAAMRTCCVPVPRGKRLVEACPLCRVEEEVAGSFDARELLFSAGPAARVGVVPLGELAVHGADGAGIGVPAHLEHGVGVEEVVVHLGSCLRLGVSS
jgi:hypothetical protein